MEEVRMKVIHAATTLISLLAVFPAAAQDWKPERNVEVIVPSGPGGGTDKTGRAVQSLLQNLKLVDKSTVVNKPGAGGRLGLIYLNQYAGDGHYVSVSTVPLLTNHITGSSNVTYTDVTPLAQLFSEYILFAVRADSPVKDGRDLIARLKQDPQSLSFGVTAIGGTSHMVTGLVVGKAGGDAKRLKMVVFKGGGEVTSALLGGHVDVVPAPVANLLPHIKAGRLRALALSSGKRLGGDLAQMPTWRELGIDAVFDTWRGMVGPKGMTAAQMAYWDQVFTRMTGAEAWKMDLAKNHWGDNYLNSSQARGYLEQEYRDFKAILGDLGLAK
jgi:putative tricarboxylic transport membrane protein